MWNNYKAENALIKELFHQINIRISYSLLMLVQKEKGLMLEDRIFLDESTLFEKKSAEYIMKEYVYTDVYLRVFKISFDYGEPLYTIQLEEFRWYRDIKILFGDMYLERLAEDYTNSLKEAYNKICEDYLIKDRFKSIETQEQAFGFYRKETFDELEKVICAVQKLRYSWKSKLPNGEKAEYDLFQKAGTTSLSYMRAYMAKRFGDIEADMIIDPIYPYAYLKGTDVANTCVINELYIVQYNWECIKKDLLRLYKEDEEVEKIKTEAGKRYWFLHTFGSVLKHLYLHEYKHILDYIEQGMFKLSEEEIDDWVSKVKEKRTEVQWEVETEKAIFILFEDYSRILGSKPRAKSW